MAVITINVPAGAVPDVVAAFQAYYPGEWVAAQAAGQTGVQFVQHKLVGYVEDLHRTYKVAQQPAPAAPAPAGVT